MTDVAERSDGVKTRAWVEAYYAPEGDSVCPAEDQYDEVVCIGGRIYWLEVRPGPDDVGFTYAVKDWDGYYNCPHWSWRMWGTHATEARAWESAREGIKNLARRESASWGSGR